MFTHSGMFMHDCSLCLPVQWSETWKELKKKKRTIAPVSFFSAVFTLFDYVMLFLFSKGLLFFGP